MGALTRTFGRTPRVRLLEALVRLAPIEFTRFDATQEAGLKKSSANRTLDRLEADGFITMTSGERPIRYRVNEDNPFFRLVTISNAFSENVLAEPQNKQMITEATMSASRALRRIIQQQTDRPVWIGAQTVETDAAALSEGIQTESQEQTG